MDILWKGSAEGTETQLAQFALLEDNYSYILFWNNLALAFDPAQAAPLLDFLKEKQLELHAVFNTHHHSDHVKGNEELKEKTECQILGPEDEKVPGLDQGLEDGEELIIGPLTIQVIGTPGHTLTHLVYYLSDLQLLFSGDTLFCGGCGRLFEGTPEEMLESLKKITALPPGTLIFCGHEYTKKNLEFALTVDPENEALKRRLDHVKSLRENHRSTMPGTIAEELLTNPFLRVSDPSIQKQLGLEGASEIEVFYKLRELRNQF